MISDNQDLLYHGEQAESTTGTSQFDYLLSPPDLKHSPSTAKSWGSEEAFLFALASCGLTPATRYWIARNPGELARLTSGPSKTRFPLFSLTFFVPMKTKSHEGHLQTIRLLLENGFRISADGYFYPLLCSAL
jgi:hypothetical protein